MSKMGHSRWTLMNPRALYTRIPSFPDLFAFLTSNNPHRQWSRYRGIEFRLTHKDDTRLIRSIKYSIRTRTTAYLVYRSFPPDCTTFLVNSLSDDAIPMRHRHLVQLL